MILPLAVLPTFDWFTGLVGLVSAIVSLSVSYFIAKRKSKTDSFESIIQANEKFRDEVRKDLNICKKELDASKEELESYKDTVQKLEKEIVNSQNDSIKLKFEILEYKQKILDLTNKISEYEKTIFELKEKLEKCQGDKKG